MENLTPAEVEALKEKAVEQVKEEKAKQPPHKTGKVGLRIGKK